MKDGPGWWWLSFSNPHEVPGRQFLGVIIVEAAGFRDAIDDAWRRKINPGGEVAGRLLGQPPAEKYRNRLVREPEVHEIGDLIQRVPSAGFQRWRRPGEA